MGNLFDFCVEKNPHMPDGDSMYKYKALVDCQGNRVFETGLVIGHAPGVGNRTGYHGGFS